MATFTEICLQIEGQEICVRIPFAVIREWGWPPDDDPLRNVRDWVEPSPDPWRTDLPIIATIDRLVAHVSDDRVQETLRGAVRQATEQVAARLPAGVRLNMTGG